MFAKFFRSKNPDNINVSPWIKELKKDRKINNLTKDINIDVAIVGGGISGFATAFFTLKNTDKSVILIEAGRIGRGATGHNAGQVVDYFEKPFSEIVNEYGLELASDAQKNVTSAWNLLDEILHDTKMDIEFSKFTGFAGCSDLEQLITHFENKKLKQQGGIEVKKVRVASNFKDLNKIPEKYNDLFEVVDQSVVLELLETNNTGYIAVLQSQKGCLNSALFVEKLSEYLLEKYSNRFRIFEQSPVSTLDLYNSIAVLQIKDNFIAANKVVLCTNGFENIKIVNKAGENIDKKYHSMIYGIVGYMAGYTEEKSHDPVAISYLPQKNIPQDESRPYYYLTRRNHQDKSLICVGGPEKIETEDEFKYIETTQYPTHAKNEILDFLHSTFKRAPAKINDFHFKWHGLMGYTKNGIRCVGEEPLNAVLLYNLGCNGIGILPSLFGGSKISKHLAGIEVKESIFDPKVQRSIL